MKTLKLTAMLLVLLAAAILPAPAESHPDVGVFLGRIEVSTELAGGPVLHLALAFSTVDHTFAGTAYVTQALRQPIVWSGHAYGFWHAPLPRNTQFLVLSGSNVPPTAPLEPTLEFRLNTPATITIDGKRFDIPGEGKLRYRQNGLWTPWLNGKTTVVECEYLGS
ncbi:MAG: DUF1842 domain-containing protein [Holophagales bacterium]|nr:DUF1842 domain-containing protein [Holophagales bacterium]